MSKKNKRYGSKVRKDGFGYISPSKQKAIDEAFEVKEKWWEENAGVFEKVFTKEDRFKDKNLYEEHNNAKQKFYDSMSQEEKDRIQAVFKRINKTKE